jgi:hypothetical protein
MKHVRGMLRVAGYLGITSLVFSAYSVKVARAEMQNTTLTLGREMAQLASPKNHDVTPITLNGQHIYLGSSISDEEPSAVLDRYEGICKADPGQPARGWTEVEKLNGGPVENAPELGKTGFMRSGDNREGTVLCFVRGENTGATVQESFANFMQTGELGALGKLRYVYARKTANGHTHVLTAWTESKFNFAEMMPEEGKDAPGADFAEVPRVPNGVRALSASAEGLPYGINVYKTPDAPAKTLAFYDDTMVKAGWRGYNPELSEEEHGTQGRAYIKEGVVLTVSTKVQPEGNFVALGVSGIAEDKGAPTVSR